MFTWRRVAAQLGYVICALGFTNMVMCGRGSAVHIASDITLKKYVLRQGTNTTHAASISF